MSPGVNNSVDPAGPTKAFSRDALRQTGPRRQRTVWFLGLVTLVTTVTIASIRPSETYAPVDGDVPIMPPTQILSIAGQQGEITRTVIPGFPSQLKMAPGATTPDAGDPWIRITVQRGDTLGALFQRLNLNTGDIAEYARTNIEARQLYRLYPGQVLGVRTDGAGRMLALRYPLNDTENLVLTWAPAGFHLERTTRNSEIQLGYASGTIQSSLFLDGQAAGLADAQIMQLVDIFGWDIDFAQDLREGDSFSAIFESTYADGQKLNDGPIVAAEFINQGKVYRAIGYRDARGQISYFSPEGMSLRRAFLRSPLKFSRITSRFSLGRFHPILKKWRAHDGVDYGAPTGTPVMATASGRVQFVGIKGGYGNTVILKHGGSYNTLYAHLSRFQAVIRSGAYVEQGQVVGYVGQTGLATGPHLHYEFQVDGAHHNPLTYKFPQAEPISAEQKREFLQTAATLGQQLDQLSRSSLADRR
jgi:murein DD-endopeptidase MepM/ murein hydrolase activator NlpD